MYIYLTSTSSIPTPPIISLRFSPNSSGRHHRVHRSWPILINLVMGKQAYAGRKRNESLLTRWVNSVFVFVRFAEFEILFVLFFLIAFIIFKDLTARPEYNQILLKKPGGPDWWSF